MNNSHNCTKIKKDDIEKMYFTGEIAEMAAESAEMFYRRGNSPANSLQKFGNLKRLRKVPVSNQELSNIIKKFKTTLSLVVQSGIGVMQCR